MRGPGDPGPRFLSGWRVGSMFGRIGRWWARVAAARAARRVHWRAVWQRAALEAAADEATAEQALEEAWVRAAGRARRPRRVPVRARVTFRDASSESAPAVAANAPVQEVASNEPVESTLASARSLLTQGWGWLRGSPWRWGTAAAIGVFGLGYLAGGGRKETVVLDSNRPWQRVY